MKLTIGIDPGKSGGYAIGWGGMHSIHLHTLGEDFEFVEHIQDLKDHPDVTSIEAVVELVPPFAGKMIPSSSSFKRNHFKNGGCNSDPPALSYKQITMSLPLVK